MSRYSGQDNYLDPVSGVLKNRLGIKNPAILEQTEASLVALRSYELAQNPLQGNFDLAHLQAIHRYLFGDLYDWAGQLRTVDLIKGQSMFAHHAYIESAATQIFWQLAKERHLADLQPSVFSVRAGYFLGELNALHPFREGNGRVLREFISHLAHANGYYIAWERVNQQQMLDASIESFRGDSSQLAALILDNICSLI